MKVSTAARRWSRLSLPRQFVLAGGVVMLVAMLLVGSWVSRRIEQAAVQNFAIVAANVNGGAILGHGSGGIVLSRAA